MWSDDRWAKEVARGAIVRGNAAAARTDDGTYDRTVEVVGLVRRMDLNGRTGVVKYFDTAKRRYVVKLAPEVMQEERSAAAESTTTIAVTGDNLRLVSRKTGGCFDLLQRGEGASDPCAGTCSGGSGSHSEGAAPKNEREDPRLHNLLGALPLRLREGELDAICAALGSLGFDDPDVLADPLTAEELSVPCLKNALVQWLGVGAQPPDTDGDGSEAERPPPSQESSQVAKATRAPGLAIQLRRALSVQFNWPAVASKTGEGARDGSENGACATHRDDDDDGDVFFDAEIAGD